MSKSIRIFIGSVLVLVASSPVMAAKSNKELTADVTNMQQSVNAIQQDMARLQRLLDNRGMLELFQRVDELADEVSELRGMLEQQSHDLAGVKKRQRELYLDIDRRLRELEITTPRSAAPVAPLPAVSAPTPSAPATASTTPAATTTAPAAPAQNQPMVAKPATIAAPNRSNGTVSEERAGYQKAFDMLKEGRYKMANAEFKGFLTKYPQSSYAGNAQYWLGESNYVSRQFEQAVTEFGKVMNNYPASNKVPDAMLKLGYTYYELKQFDQARNILSQLQQKYPQSTAARLAGKRLNRMKREGR
jgi:tol-pal system protein YbgF